MKKSFCVSQCAAEFVKPDLGIETRNPSKKRRLTGTSGSSDYYSRSNFISHGVVGPDVLIE
jgi:hypothetical protein